MIFLCAMCEMARVKPGNKSVLDAMPIYVIVVYCCKLPKETPPFIISVLRHCQQHIGSALYCLALIPSHTCIHVSNGLVFLRFILSLLIYPFSAKYIMRYVWATR